LLKANFASIFTLAITEQAHPLWYWKHAPGDKLYIDFGKQAFILHVGKQGRD